MFCRHVLEIAERWKHTDLTVEFHYVWLSRMLFTGLSIMSLTILVADDDLGIRVAVSDYLELSGYIVTTAVDGRDAVTKVEQELPHLLIADVSMPRLSGHELVKQIRRQPRFRLLPVIFLTERTELNDRIRGYEVGCDVYLPKPFELQELGVIVRNLLERSQLIESEWRSRLHQMAPPQSTPVPPSTPSSTTPESSTHPVSSAQSQDRGEPRPELQQLHLTRREQDVLIFLAQGFSNNQIGEQLHLSPRTIEKYVSRLLSKSDTHNRAELLRFAMDHGLVET